MHTLHTWWCFPITSTPLHPALKQGSYSYGRSLAQHSLFPSHWQQCGTKMQNKTNRDGYSVTYKTEILCVCINKINENTDFTWVHLPRKSMNGLKKLWTARIKNWREGLVIVEQCLEAQQTCREETTRKYPFELRARCITWLKCSMLITWCGRGHSGPGSRTAWLVNKSAWATLVLTHYWVGGNQWINDAIHFD